MNCPQCSLSLQPENYQSINLQRCSACQGCWIQPDQFRQAASHHEKTYSPALVRDTLKKAQAGIPVTEQTNRRHCPSCTTPMRALNYSYSSGVIIDVCSDHGLWFDRDELERIEAFHDEWEAKKDDLSQEYRPALQQAEKEYWIGYHKMRAENRDKLFLHYSLGRWLDQHSESREKS